MPWETDQYLGIPLPFRLIVLRVSAVQAVLGALQGPTLHRRDRKLETNPEQQLPSPAAGAGAWPAGPFFLRWKELQGPIPGPAGQPLSLPFLSSFCRRF